MKSLYISLSAVLLVFVIACSASKSGVSESTKAKKESSDQINNLNPAVDLADHLKRVPGLSVTGAGSNAKVSIRGMASFSGDNEPLFVINGNPINGGLSAASAMVSVADIKFVRVLKTPSETSAYGIRGSNGVIEINLNKK